MFQAVGVVIVTLNDSPVTFPPMSVQFCHMALMKHRGLYFGQEELNLFLSIEDCTLDKKN
jgi:hypothetical protein